MGVRRVYKKNTSQREGKNPTTEKNHGIKTRVRKKRKNKVITSTKKTKAFV